MVPCPRPPSPAPLFFPDLEMETLQFSLCCCVRGGIEGKNLAPKLPQQAGFQHCLDSVHHVLSPSSRGAARRPRPTHSSHLHRR